MRGFLSSLSIVIVCLGMLILPAVVRAQGGASISGTVADPSGGVVVNATVEIHNPVSGYSRSATTDSSGNFSFPNVPFNPCRWPHPDSRLSLRMSTCDPSFPSILKSI
jgi:hypothetical protein